MHQGEWLDSRHRARGSRDDLRGRDSTWPCHSTYDLPLPQGRRGKFTWASSRPWLKWEGLRLDIQSIYLVVERTEA